jgi:hypothetical protein
MKDKKGGIKIRSKESKKRMLHNNNNNNNNNRGKLEGSDRGKERISERKKIYNS